MKTILPPLALLGVLHLAAARIDLMAGGSVLASDNNSLAGSIPDGEFRTSTVLFSPAR